MRLGRPAPAEAIALRMTSVLSYSGPGRMPGSLLENCAITLGRTAWRCADQLAQHLGHFVAPWCAQLRNIRDGTEKEHAFLGLCRWGGGHVGDRAGRTAVDRAGSSG